MDEDSTIIEPQQKQEVPQTDQPGQVSSRPGSGNVFEITPNLDISPVKETIEPPKTNSGTITENEVPRDQLYNQLLQELGNGSEGPSETPANPFVAAITENVSGEKIVHNEQKRPLETTAGPNSSSLVRSMRTYESDIAEVMSRGHTSTASMIIAKNQKEDMLKRASFSRFADNKPATIEIPSARGVGKNAMEGAPTEKKIEMAPAMQVPPVTDDSVRQSLHIFRKSFIVIISLILIGGGVAAAYYLYKVSPLSTSKNPATKTNTPQTTTSSTKSPTGVIQVDMQTIFPVDGKNASAILSGLRTEIDKNQPMNSIREIIPTETTNGTVVRLSATTMLSRMDITPPDILTRSLLPSWMLGVYADNNEEKNTFVIVTNNFFQNTFAGILQWESVMPDELKQFLYDPRQLEDIITDTQTDQGQATVSSSTTSTVSSTTTSTTTEPISVRSYFTIRGQFKDRIVKNRDVREFITDDGQILFLYSFIDNKKLIIATSESVISEILSRLEKQTFVR